ncbi:DUF2177 family protein [Rhizobium rosettiformans]|jgi:uncharacterized membrane protein|uniref:DUF2177 family protein n=1 Tax=Rhizobium rosettiformans TaxID=1368430 RepID=UPI00285FD87F|nr:DUF2177 family protein [Rhizobium rosettiformans]MDR7028001.1 putative membrane protein [Rhizobium rosettiformans]MDR7064717.1 putative membrane protein [Rhizobium rosettiformans]
MPYVIAYISTAVVFFALDYLWLTRIAIGFYREQIGSLMLASPNFAAAGVFYLFYVVGVVYFAVMPAVSAGSLVTALINGALLGLLAYGTYDMTNLATLKGWSLQMSLVDMAWGAFLTATAAAAGYLAVSRFAQ